MKNNFLIILITILLLFNLSTLHAQEIKSTESSNHLSIEKGKELAFNRKKGNCLACHYIQGGSLMGNTGPALIAMQQRFPDKSKLSAQVYDARINNQQTFMPPFGAHGILTKQEIKLIVNWLYTL